MLFKYLLISLCWISAIYSGFPYPDHIAKMLWEASGKSPMHWDAHQVEDSDVEDWQHLSEFAEDAGETSTSQERISRVPAIRKTLEARQVELNTFSKDAQELSGLLSAIGKHPKAEDQWYSFKYKSLNAVYRFIKALKYKEYSELGGVLLTKSNNKLISKLFEDKEDAHSQLSRLQTIMPHEIIQEITNKMWKNAGSEFVLNDLKQFMGKTSSLIRIGDPREQNQDLVRQSLLFPKAQFKMIDIVLKTHHADIDSIKTLFADPVLVYIVVTYSYHRFKLEIGESLLNSRSPYLTDHWYWPLLNYSFGAVDKGQKKVINIYLLFLRLRIASLHLRQSGHWRVFQQENKILSAKSASDAHIEIIRFINMMAEKGADIINTISKDVKAITNILMITSDPDTTLIPIPIRQELDCLLVDTLKLYKHYISTVAVDQVTGQHHQYQNFNDRYDLIDLASEIEHLNQQATGRLEYKHLIEQDPQRSKKFGERLRALVVRMEKTIQKFTAADSRVWVNQLAWRQIQPRIDYVRHTAPHWLNSLKEALENYKNAV